MRKKEDIQVEEEAIAEYEAATNATRDKAEKQLLKVQGTRKQMRKDVWVPYVM